MIQQGDQGILRAILGALQNFIPIQPSKIIQIPAEKIKGGTQ